MAGSTIALPGFIQDFGLVGNVAHVNNLKSNVVAVLQAGCFFGGELMCTWDSTGAYAFSTYGCPDIAAVRSSNHSPRLLDGVLYRRCCSDCCHHRHQLHLVSVSSVELTCAHTSVGRVLAGLGVGAMSAVAPPYVSENAPKEIRGRVTGLFQFILAGGVMISYWIPYGVSVHVPPSRMQWRIPIAFQIVPAALMFISLFFVKESPRWLAFVGREEEALVNLAYLRKCNRDDPELVSEFAEIMAAIEEERELKSGNPYKEMLKKGQWPRLLIALSMMFFTQWSG